MKILILILILCSLNIQAARLRLLSTDQDALQARVDLIQQAEHEILAEYFSVWEDAQSIGGFALLLEAARRGVKVKIIMDALSNTVPKSFFATMLEKGKDAQGNANIEIKLYNPISLNLFRLTHRDHAKMLIVDGKRMITGGRNVGDKYFGLNTKRNFKDIDILLDGPGVTEAREDFLATFNSEIVKDATRPYRLPSYVEQKNCIKSTDRETRLCERQRQHLLRTYKKTLARIEENLADILEDTPDSIVKPNTGTDWLAGIQDGADVDFISHQPDEFVSKENAHLSVAILEFAKSTRNDLNILSPYLIPTANTLTLFEDIIARGGTIRIVTNSLQSTDNLFAQAGYFAYKDKLIKMGVELYEFNGPDTSHGKVAVVDGSVAFVGTYNLDPRSAFLNREVGVFIKSSPNNHLANTLTEEIERYRQNSLLVGINGKPQNIEEQEKRMKEYSKTKKAALRVIRLFVPLFKDQL